MNREERIKRDVVVAELRTVVEQYIGADEVDVEPQKIADLLETSGKLLLPYHHVTVKAELLAP